VQLRKQRLHDGVIGYAHANGTAFRVLQPARYLSRGRQHERIAPRGSLAHDPELPVVETRKMANLGEIAQHEREAVRSPDATQFEDAPGRRGVANLAAKCVTRVGRVGDHPARAQDRSRLPNQSRLRIDRMDLEKLGHDARGGGSRHDRSGTPIYNPDARSVQPRQTAVFPSDSNPTPAMPS
jgi:hypothetical protein